MSSLKRQEGNIVQVVADAAYTVDIPVKIGTAMFGVPVKTVASGADVGVEVKGIFALPKVADVAAYTLGDNVYWAAGTSKATNVTTDSFIGVCTKAAASSATSVEVMINGTVGDPADSDVVFKSLYDANTILIATSDNTPIALAVATNTLLGRQAGAIDDIALAVQSIPLRGAADIVAQAVADSEFVGRSAGGNLGVVTAAQARTIIKATTEALFDDLASAAVIDGDRIKTAGIAFKQLPVQSLATLGDDAAPITAAQMVAGLSQCTPTAGRSKATDAAAAIISVVGSDVGTNFDFSICNISAGANTITVTAGASVTLIGAATVGQNVSGLWRIFVTAPTTVTMIRIA